MAANVANIDVIVNQAREAFKVANANATETAASVAANNADAIKAMNYVRATNASLNAVRIFAEKGTPSSAALDAAVNAAAQTVNSAEANTANVAATGINRNQAAADQVKAAKSTLLALLQMKQQYEQMIANQETQNKRQLAEQEMQHKRQLAELETQHKHQLAAQETQYKHQLAAQKQVIADLAAADLAKTEKQRLDKLDTAAAALTAEIAELST